MIRAVGLGEPTVRVKPCLDTRPLPRAAPSRAAGAKSMAQSKTKQQATPAFQRVRSLRLGAELPPAEALHDVDHRRAQYAQRNLRNNKKLPSFQLGRTDTVAGLDLKTREEMAEWAADQPQEPATLGTRLDQMQDAFKLARQQSMARGVSVAGACRLAQVHP